MSEVQARKSEQDPTALTCTPPPSRKNFFSHAEALRMSGVAEEDYLPINVVAGAVVVVATAAVLLLLSRSSFLAPSPPTPYQEISIKEFRECHFFTCLLTSKIN